MLDHLCNSGSYKKLTKYPLKKVSKTVSLAIKSSSTVRSLSKKLIEGNPLIPRIYGFPKIHNEGVPLSPIVNTIGGPTYLLANFLTNKLKPLAGRFESFFKDSYSFANELKDFRFDREDQLVSFDVVSLFTNIPINEAIDVINHITDLDTSFLVKICLTSTFFNFEGEFYEKTCIVSMGSPLPPVVANLFMEDFEYRALTFSLYQPKLWKRFVDDTCVVRSHGKEKLEVFYHQLNSQSNYIKFTMEFEIDGSHLFLMLLS